MGSLALRTYMQIQFYHRFTSPTVTKKDYFLSLSPVKIDLHWAQINEFQNSTHKGVPIILEV